MAHIQTNSASSQGRLTRRGDAVRWEHPIRFGAEIILSLDPVTPANWRDIAALHVAPDQIDFIESTPDCLLEAAYDTQLDWHPFGLYDSDRPVGFTMIGAYNAEQHTIWLDRFMIDEHAQHQGYGRQFFAKTVAYIKATWPVRQIFLSAHEENTEIFPFYESFGFINTHKKDPSNGEIIMTMTW